MSSNVYDDTTGVFNGLPPNNLPRGLPKVLGRESELLQIKRLLSQKRLVILSGVDGVGKTCLAREGAVELAGQFQHGVFFVPFESIVLPEFVPNILGTTLGIELDPRFDPTEQFLTALSSKSLLLILDGFGHIPQYVPLLKEIKERAPSVRMIITTSKPLDLANEAVLELHGLAVPGRTDSDAETSPSVQLFLQNARVHPDLEPDLEAIGHICRLLDGMPLAIEMAASWSSILSSEQIVQRIEQSLALHPPERISGELQSMLATFDAVWNLLSENEKRMLQGLSVFKGSFSYQAATRITSASFFFIDELLSKRILQRTDLQRYALHAAFANFLQEKLQDNPVLATDIEIRHGSFFLGLLRDSEYSLQHSSSGAVLEEILSDVDNMRLAWKRTVAAGNLRLTQSALGAWIIILESRGWLREAIQALQSLGTRLSESRDDMPEATLSYLQVKKSLAQLHYQLEEYETGIAELQSALQRLEGKDFPDEESEVYRSLGDHYRATGRFENSREMYRHALVSAEKTGDLLLIYESIDSLGEQAYLEADYPTAISTTEHGLEIARQLQDKTRIAESQANLGKLYFTLSDYQRAKDALTDAQTIAPDAKGQFLKVSILGLLGKTLTASKEYGQAYQAFAKGLRSLKENYAASLAVEMLVDIAELLNTPNEKALALTVVNLVKDHPAARNEVREKAAHLQETLTADNVQPEDRDWNANQLQQVIVDLPSILEEKAAGQ